MPLTIWDRAEPEIDKIIRQSKTSQLNIVKIYPAFTDYYRLQDSYHGGNGVFFNKDPQRESRYAIPDRSKGAFYVAAMPLAAFAEMYKGGNFIDL